MLWILPVVLVLVLLARQRTRKFGIAVGIVFGLVLAWAMQRSDFGDVLKRVENPTLTGTPSIQAFVPPLDSVSVQDLQLSGSGAPWRFSGKVANLSTEYQISSATFRITRFDCYQGAGTPDDCLAVWRGEQTVALNLPAQQTRNFVTEIWLHGSALRLKGNAKDEFALLRLTGARTGPDGQPAQ